MADNEFIRQQIAGDEIEPGNPQMLVTAGFHRLGAIRKLKSQLRRSSVEEKKILQEQIAAAEGCLPPPPPMIATVTNSEPTAIHILKRGNWDSKGELVNPRGLQVLLPHNTPWH